MGFVSKFLKRFLWKAWRGKLYPFQVLLKVLPDKLIRFLWIAGVFVFLIVPSMLGTYSFLRFQGVPWFIAVFSTLGIELGGPLISVLHNLAALSKASGVEQGIILVGMFLTLLHMHTLYRIYKGLMRAFQTTINSVLLWMIGGSVLALLIGITVLTDVYILTDVQLRLTGITYFLESPGAALDPLVDLVGGEFRRGPGFDLKTVVSNSSVGGKK